MQLSPRYGTDPVIEMDGDPSAILEPTIRQRRRLAKVLAAFTEQQWAHPSRCAEWSNRDVIVHLNSTNSFWGVSIAAGLRGTPTEFLATFDPARTPAELVTGAGELSFAQVLEQFVASTESLAQQLLALSAGDWTKSAEAPPGHISISAVAHHALWDSLVHERDILLPLGIDPATEADEISASLRYAAALGPALAITHGADQTGRIAIKVVDPDLSFVVEIAQQVSVRAGGGAADLVLTGSAVELLEALSIRRTLNQPIPASAAWMLSGLSDTFDTAQ